MVGVLIGVLGLAVDVDVLDNTMEELFYSM